jgi:hypothetical protein
MQHARCPQSKGIPYQFTSNVLCETKQLTYDMHQGLATAQASVGDLGEAAGGRQT